MTPRNPIGNAMHKMIDRQMERHSWLIRAGEDIRRMNEEEKTREAGVANNAPASNS